MALTPEQIEAIQAKLDAQRDLELELTKARQAVQIMVDLHEIIPSEDLMGLVNFMKNKAKGHAQEIVDLHT